MNNTETKTTVEQEILTPTDYLGLWLEPQRVQQILDMPDVEDMPETLDELHKEIGFDQQIPQGEQQLC